MKSPCCGDSTFSGWWAENSLIFWGLDFLLIVRRKNSKTIEIRCEGFLADCAKNKMLCGAFGLLGFVVIKRWRLWHVLPLLIVRKVNEILGVWAFWFIVGKSKILGVRCLWLIANVNEVLGNRVYFGCVFNEFSRISEFVLLLVFCLRCKQHVRVVFFINIHKNKRKGEERRGKEKERRFSNILRPCLDGNVYVSKAAPTARHSARGH